MKITFYVKISERRKTRLSVCVNIFLKSFQDFQVFPLCVGKLVARTGKIVIHNSTPKYASYLMEENMTKMHFDCYWKTRFHYIVIADFFFLTFWCQFCKQQIKLEMEKKRKMMTVMAEKRLLLFVFQKALKNLFLCFTCYVKCHNTFANCTLLRHQKSKSRYTWDREREKYFNEDDFDYVLEAEIKSISMKTFRYWTVKCFSGVAWCSLPCSR